MSSSTARKGIQLNERFYKKGKRLRNWINHGYEGSEPSKVEQKWRRVIIGIILLVLGLIGGGVGVAIKNKRNKRTQKGD